MTRSELFTEAHKLAKTFVGDYKACFVLALKEIKSSAKKTMNKYQLAAQKDKQSWEKAREKGNFVTVEDLKEYRNLIIFMAKKSSYYSGHSWVKAIMTKLMEYVNNKELVYRTKRGIKGVIVSAVKHIGVDMSIDAFWLNHDILRDNQYNNKDVSNFISWRLKVLM